VAYNTDLVVVVVVAWAGRSGRASTGTMAAVLTANRRRRAAMTAAAVATRERREGRIASCEFFLF